MLRLILNLKRHFYNNPNKYAENRLSGFLDIRPNYFISLNSLLSSGIVIEVEECKVINNTLNLVHFFLKLILKL